MGAKNKVVAGDYINKKIESYFGQLLIRLSPMEHIYLDKNTVEAYELVDQTKKKSAASAVGRGLAGGLALSIVGLGPVGLLAGLSAKSKGTQLVAIQFKDEKKCLIEVDDKIYSVLVKKLF